MTHKSWYASKKETPTTKLPKLIVPRLELLLRRFAAFAYYEIKFSLYADF